MAERGESHSSTDALSIQGLSFGYTRSAEVLQHLNLRLAEGEIAAILGASGCGKTTLLRLIAGLERPSCGSILIDDEPVADTNVYVLPERRRVGYVFQDFALFPHLSVIRNVMFGMRGIRRRARCSEAERLLSSLGLEGMAHRMPHTLSGGQQQRVAVARALASSPRLVMLDEPFSAIDATQRERTRELVIGHLRDAGVATLLVTHNEDEAAMLADRIIRIDRVTDHQTNSKPMCFQNSSGLTKVLKPIP